PQVSSTEGSEPPSRDRSPPSSPERQKCVERSFEDEDQQMYLDQEYESEYSEHSENEAAAPLFSRRSRRTRLQLTHRVETLVQDLRERQEVFRRRQKDLTKASYQRLRSEFLRQEEQLVQRSRRMVATLQSGRSRAWRHKWVFAVVQADFVVSAFWLGASPETFYFYYSAQMLLVLSCKVFDYRVNLQHYFLLDFCFFANL
ncbi:unnamed protein product, partial [Polarella glacialis]